MIKDKFKYLPEDEFVPLEGVPKNYASNYLINKKGEIKGIKFKKVLSATVGNYPFVSLYSKEKSEKPLHGYIHRLVALTFLENDNPSEKTEVDHIDRDTTNYHVNNLRWVSRLANINNSKYTPRYNNCSYQKLDQNGKVIETISFKELSREEKGKISASIRNKTKYKGYFWNRYDPNVNSYIKLHGEPAESDWKESPIPGIFCNKNGLVKYNKKNLQVITVGTKNRDGYYSVGKTLVSRLVYSTFIINILDNSSVIIDHINTDREDNRLINLRATDYKGNSSNEITLDSKKKKIKSFDIFGNFIKEYDQAQDAASELGISRSYINTCCLLSSVTENTKDGSTYWCYSGEESVIQEKVLEKTIFEYNSDREVMGGYLYVKQIPVDPKSVFKSILTRKACTANGNFYSRGPKDITNDLEWMTDKNKKRDYNQKCFSFNSKGELTKEYESIYQASMETGIPKSKISDCCEYGDTVHTRIDKERKFTFWSFLRIPTSILKGRICKYDSNNILVDSFCNISEASKYTESDLYRIGVSMSSGEMCSDNFYYRKEI